MEVFRQARNLQSLSHTHTSTLRTLLSRAHLSSYLPTVIRRPSVSLSNTSLNWHLGQLTLQKSDLVGPCRTLFFKSAAKHLLELYDLEGLLQLQAPLTFRQIITGMKHFGQFLQVAIWIYSEEPVQIDEIIPMPPVETPDPITREESYEATPTSLLGCSAATAPNGLVPLVLRPRFGTELLHLLLC